MEIFPKPTAGVAVPKKQPKVEFHFIKQLADGVWLVERIFDRAEFLAQRLTEFDEHILSDNSRVVLNPEQQDAKGLRKLLYDCNQQRSVMLILNHENLVSVAGWTRRQWFATAPDRTEDYLVWDHCDAGSLQQQFHGRTFTYDPKFGFMPESFCWHVLISVLRALAWLHDGYREDRPFVSGPNGVARSAPKEGKIDADWNSILHRDISAHSIFFQHPRGKETYGVCKLGNFSKVFVSGHFLGDESQGVGQAKGIAIAPRNANWATQDVLRKTWGADRMTVDPDDRAYTIGDEQYALGNLVYRMMRGADEVYDKLLPPPYTCGENDCDCVHVLRCPLGGCAITHAKKEEGYACVFGGCEHVRAAGACAHTPEAAREQRCNHRCRFRGTRPVNVDDALARLPYSKALRAAVRKLLGYDGKHVPYDTKGALQFAEKKFYWWRAKTVEGQEYVDTEDDLEVRLQYIAQVKNAADEKAAALAAAKEEQERREEEEGERMEVEEDGV